MDVSLELLWCIFCIWMSRWVSCVYIPNLEQLPVLWKALKMAEAMKENESRIQIAGQNGGRDDGTWKGFHFERTESC